VRGEHQHAAGQNPLEESARERSKELEWWWFSRVLLGLACAIGVYLMNLAQRIGH
jgi:hypothetical protein